MLLSKVKIPSPSHSLRFTPRPHRMKHLSSMPRDVQKPEWPRRMAAKHWATAWALGLTATLSHTAGASEAFADKLLQLGTGPTVGAFSPIGRSLCDAVNEDRSRTLVRCVPVATAGSVFNLTAVSIGQLQLGIAQEDLYAAAVASNSPEAAGLRSIAVLHASPIAVVVRTKSGVENLNQLAGKVMNLGNRGSGQFAITAALLKALNLKVSDLAGVTYGTTNEFEKLFCEGKVDVVVEAVAHPSSVFEKLYACGGHILSIPAEVARAMQASNPYLKPMVIASSTYASQTQSIQTLGMRNVLFTHTQTDAQAVQRFTTALASRTQQLRSTQPLLSSMPNLTLANTGALPAPLHTGAARALQESRP